MALRTVAAFAAGFAAGWAGRSAFGSTREALVQGVVAAHKIREGARRVVAEQVEWAEDLIAEGRARYEQLRGAPPVDDEAPPQVVGIGKRERAA